jgi:single-stranded-DNA-specific exonuclease
VAPGEVGGTGQGRRQGVTPAGAPGRVQVMKAWKLNLAEAGPAEALAHALDLPAPLAGVLVRRGYATAEAAEAFLNPRLSRLSDPFRLPGMREATGRLWAARDRGEPIVIFGDYDVDGVTSAALLTRVLVRLGFAAVPFLPHRMEDGYGLSRDALIKCARKHKPRLVITVDCGTSSTDAVRWAAQHGIDVIITDHHEPTGELAPARAVVNPKLGEHPAERGLAGVGVVFKLCHALLKQAREDGRELPDIDLKSHLDLVAVGTIADLVPLVEDNRIYARFGLERLNATTNPGLQALIEVAGRPAPVDAYHVGFLMGPRLNAAGRLGDARLALELLLTEDAARARELAAHLDAANRERQTIEQEIFEQAVEQIDREMAGRCSVGLVAAHRDWHAGVIGIVASRLVARYHRPVVVIALDGKGRGRGSGRSIEGFDMVRALERCSTDLLKFGGHVMAAGLDIEEEAVPRFRERFNEVAAGWLNEDALVPVQRVDGWLELSDASEEFMVQQERLRPFGQGNTTPVWAARGVSIAGAPRVVGHGHLKLTVAQGRLTRDAIGFGLGLVPVPDGPLDIAFQLKRNTYQGRTSIQLSLQDLRPAEASFRLR